jgi:hypothetical protein
MIDTDKYEGHTEGPWKEVDFNWGERTSPNGAYIPTDDYIGCIKDVADVVFVNDGGTTDANWNLIKDAPLLLAEVKRLLSTLNEVRDILLNDNKGCEDSSSHYALLTINEVIE